MQTVIFRTISLLRIYHELWTVTQHNIIMTQYAQFHVIIKENPLASSYKWAFLFQVFIDVCIYILNFPKKQDEFKFELHFIKINFTVQQS